MKTINLFEAFSWIWSQHLALKNIWFDVKIIWISDWYIDAIIAYSINHLQIKEIEINKKEVLEYLKNYSLSLDSKTAAKNLNWLSSKKLSIVYQAIKRFWNLDIRNISWESLIWKNIDLFTYSFPCQDISQQWKQKWFSKNKKTRSWLLWEIERILKKINHLDKKSLPKVLMMENVKALLNKNFKEDLNLWIKELEKIWYKSTYPFIVNSLNLWEAQNRERVFMFSFLWEKEIKEFEIKSKHKEKFIKDIFKKDTFHQEFMSNKNIKIIEKEQKYWIKKAFLEWFSSFNAENYLYYMNWKAPTITASWAQSRIKILYKWNIIYLNSLEHLRLQWFDEKFYKKLVEVWITETKIKFLAWNSINIKVLEELFKFYLS